MYRLLFSNWKLALIWAVGICASTGFFFAGRGDEQLTASADQVAGNSAAELDQISPDQPTYVDPDEEKTEDSGAPSER
jgi:hypothetical protein